MARSHSSPFATGRLHSVQQGPVAGGGAAAVAVGAAAVAVGAAAAAVGAAAGCAAVAGAAASGAAAVETAVLPLGVGPRGVDPLGVDARTPARSAARSCLCCAILEASDVERGVPAAEAGSTELERSATPKAAPKPTSGPPAATLVVEAAGAAAALGAAAVLGAAGGARPVDTPGAALGVTVNAAAAGADAADARAG